MWPGEFKVKVLHTLYRSSEDEEEEDESVLEEGMKEATTGSDDEYKIVKLLPSPISKNFLWLQRTPTNTDSQYARHAKYNPFVENSKSVIEYLPYDHQQDMLEHIRKETGLQLKGSPRVIHVHYSLEKEDQGKQKAALWLMALLYQQPFVLKDTSNRILNPNVYKVLEKIKKHQDFIVETWGEDIKRSGTNPSPIPDYDGERNFWKFHVLVAHKDKILSSEGASSSRDGKRKRDVS